MLGFFVMDLFVIPHVTLWAERTLISFLASVLGSNVVPNVRWDWRQVSTDSAEVRSKTSITATPNAVFQMLYRLNGGTTKFSAKKSKGLRNALFLKSPDPWNSSQTWTYVVKLDRTLYLRWDWDELILPFISYDMKNGADRKSFLWEFIVLVNRRSSLWGLPVARILRGTPKILAVHYSFFFLFSICIAGDSMIEKNVWNPS